jgi:hypothetical protein
MVKKYKLTSSDNNTQQKGGAGLSFLYPSVPSMTGLIPSTTPVIGSSVVMGGPFVPGMSGMSGMTAMTSSGSYIRSDPTGGLKIGMPLVSGTGDGLKMIIPPRIDPRDPSVFLAVEPPKPKSSTPGSAKDVTLTFKEPMPKQSLVMYQPNLPILPNPYGLQLPVGLHPTTPIVLNPTDSKARLEITSPDTDDIITISGEEDKIKPVYEGIRKNNKVRLAQDEVTLAGKEWDAVKDLTSATPVGPSIDFDSQVKGKSETDIKAIASITPEQIKSALRLKKAKEELQKAKKEAGMDDDDKDPKVGELIPLDELVDIVKITTRIENDFKVDKKDFTAQSSKKNNLQLLLGLPYRNGLNYGPIISGI